MLAERPQLRWHLIRGGRHADPGNTVRATGANKVIMLRRRSSVHTAPELVRLRTRDRHLPQPACGPPRASTQP
jgi:hypothetical protein